MKFQMADGAKIAKRNIFFAFSWAFWQQYFRPLTKLPPNNCYALTMSLLEQKLDDGCAVVNYRSFESH